MRDYILHPTGMHPIWVRIRLVLIGNLAVSSDVDDKGWWPGFSDDTT